MKKRDIRKLKGNDLVNYFANKIAKAMDELKSSHVYFVVQMAFGEDLSWHEVEKILKDVKELTNKKLK